MKVTRAVIPVAGWGTRRLPITKAIEKCMLPVNDRPIVDYVVQDCIAAGITDIYFAVSEGSTQVEAYYSRNEAFETYLTQNGKQDKISLIMPPEGVKFHFVPNPLNGKYGTSVPVSLIMHLIPDGESVAVLMGDDFTYSKEGVNEVARLLEAAETSGSAMSATEVPHEDVVKYGVLETNEDGKLTQIIEKPTPDEAPTNLVNISKYIITYDLLQEITRSVVEQERDSEYYITDVINDYVKNGGSMAVVPIKSQYLDGGSFEGWMEANRVVNSA